MKNIIKLLILFICLAVTCISAYAKEYDAYYYVSSTMGEHHNDGRTPKTPRKTFTDGNLLAAADPGETVAIVFMDEYKLSGGVLNAVQHTNNFVYTTNDGKTDYAKVNGAKLVFGKGCLFQIGGPSVFENITIEYTNTLSFVGNYNSMTFTKSLDLKKLNNDGNGVYVYGGHREPNDSVTDVELDSHLIFEGGDYYLVFGGSRNLGKNEDGSKSSTKYFEGTHYIDIRGGNFKMVYGGSFGNHVAHSANITVSGGNIEHLYTAGDETRRLNGDAVCNLTGGYIREFQVNNTMGEAHIYLSGAKLDKASVLCYNDTLTQMESQADNKKVLYCNTNYYTDKQIGEYGADFDVVEKDAYFYADSSASFAAAFKSAAANGGRIIITKDITLNGFAEPAHEKTVKIFGKDDTVSLTVNGNYTIGGRTELDGITIKGNAAINAIGGMLVIGKNVSLAYAPDISGSAELNSGRYGVISDAKTVIINGAVVESIVGGEEMIDAEVNAGQVVTLATAKTGVRSAKLHIGGGKVENLVIKGVSESLSLLYTGGSIGLVKGEGNNVKGTLTLGDRMDESLLGGGAALFTGNANRTVYAKDGGMGNGFSPTSPASFRAAYGLLRNGGTLVVVGKTTANMSFYRAPAHSGKITITSVYGGVDYRNSRGAKLVLDSNFYLGGNTDMDNLTIEAGANYVGFICNYNNVNFGKGVTCTVAKGFTTYPSIITGAKGDIANKSGTVTINGGDWQRLRLGNSGDNPTNISTSVVMNGGTIHEYVVMVTSGHRYHIGNGKFELNGGTVLGDIYGAYYSTAATVFNGKLEVVLNGGSVYGSVYATKNKTGALTGSFTITVNGGDLTKLSGIIGGNTSTFQSRLNANITLPGSVKVSGF